MTTALAPAPSPVRAPAELRPETCLHRAMRASTRTLADVLADIARGAPCPRRRHRAIMRYAPAVLREIRAHTRRAGGGAPELAAVLTDVERALPRFAADFERAFPLAAGFARLADLLEQCAGETAAPARRTPTAPVRLVRFALPWMAAQCTPAERAELLSALPAPLRGLLPFGERRYARLRTAVHGPVTRTWRPEPRLRLVPAP